MWSEVVTGSIDGVLGAAQELLSNQDLDGCNPLLTAIKNGQDTMASALLSHAEAIDAYWEEIGRAHV